MLLDIEARVGELASQEKRILGTPERLPSGRVSGSKPSGQQLKHERLGLSEKHMQQSEAISKHPEIVARVKAQTRDNEAVEHR